MIEVVPASLTHVGLLHRRLRKIDQQEVAIFSHTPKQALRLALGSACMAWTVVINGRPEAMMGVGTQSLLSSFGRPWLLMTPVAVQHARALVVLGRRYVDAMQQEFDFLHNWVHADNAAAIRWLKRLGFAIGEIEYINGHPMRALTRCATQ